MITVRTKNDSSVILMNAPTVGSHLPLSSDMIAEHTAIQMNSSAKIHLPTLPTLKKNSLNAVKAVMVSEPPSHSGFDTQYMIELIAATKRPSASRVQT